MKIKINRNTARIIKNMVKVKVKTVYHRATDSRKALTDTLDPNGKPYLVFSQNKTWHILYWKAWFSYDGRWTGSSFYDSPDPHEYKTAPSKYGFGAISVSELPFVEYAQPCEICRYGR